MSELSGTQADEMTTNYSLSQLGWKPFFQQQLTLDEWENCTPGRVVSQERVAVYLQTETDRFLYYLTKSMPKLAVGDWILLNEAGDFVRLLERYSLFSRKAAGEVAYNQLIASNVDTVFIISSLNEDFNLNRIERYLALAKETGVEPVMVLTRADICDNPEDFVDEIKAIDPFLETVTLNSLDAVSVHQLDGWCVEGNTVALLGSSGVGKSTLINTLLGEAVQLTNAIREDDAKGRHTTTRRSIHLLPSGGLLIDTPGMRELQLADCEQGVEEIFSEIAELSSRCRFNDCKHENEPGCAVRQAIDADELDERRLGNYQKLMKEQQFNAATLAERRSKDREFGKMVRNVMKSKKKR